MDQKREMELDLWKIPALAPPPGVIPNFDNPTSSSSICLVVIAVTLPLMIAFLALRAYVRLRIARALGTDDCTFTLGSVSHMSC